MEPVRIPITKETHKNRRRVVLVGTVVIIISFSVFYGLSLDSVPTINVMGIQIHIAYTGNSSGYFGKVVQNFTWNFKTLTPGELFHFTLLLKNNGNATHTIRLLSIYPSSFTLFSSEPSLPISIPGHSTQAIVFTIDPPTQGFVGDIQIDFSSS